MTLGVLIALLPVLGFPRAAESFFQVVAGLGIVLVSVWANIDRKLMLKAKMQKRQAHRKLEAEIAAKRLVQSEVDEQATEPTNLPEEPQI